MGSRHMMNEVRRDFQDELGITFEGINQTVIRLDQFGWLVAERRPQAEQHALMQWALPYRAPRSDSSVI